MKRYSPLRRKLTALIAGGGIVSALIAAAGFSYLDVNRFWQNTNAKVMAIASIVADQVEPAIALGDRKSAAEILNSLRADRTIRDAVLYDPRGGCFARMNSSRRLPRRCRRTDCIVCAMRWFWSARFGPTANGRARCCSPPAFPPWRRCWVNTSAGRP